MGVGETCKGIGLFGLNIMLVSSLNHIYTFRSLISCIVTSSPRMIVSQIKYATKAVENNINIISISGKDGIVLSIESNGMLPTVREVNKCC